MLGSKYSVTVTMDEEEDDKILPNQITISSNDNSSNDNAYDSKKDSSEGNL